MNLDLTNISKLIESKKLDEAIAIAEQELKNIPTTDFHIIIGKDLLHLTAELANFISNFDKSTRQVLNEKQGFIKNLFKLGKRNKPEAFYCEMNAFTINYDCWFIDLFSFKNKSLTNWNYFSDFYDSTENSMIIKGFEDIQKVYEDVDENDKFDEPNIYKSWEICAYIVILRLHELYRATYNTKQGNWKNIPMFVNAHDYEMIFKVN